MRRTTLFVAFGLLVIGVIFLLNTKRVGICECAKNQVHTEQKNADGTNCLPVPREERRYNSLVTDYDPCLRSWLERVAKDRLSANHPEVVALAKEIVEPPSKNLLKSSRKIVPMPQTKQVQTILGDIKNGFFIEAGGLDGERSSNTFWLETERHWSGLVVEMDPFFYTMLKGHNRKVWTANCCLSPYNYTSMIPWHQSSYGTGKLAGKVEKPMKGGSQVPCFPIASLLFAIGRTQVDYFSLDIEGFELDVLRTIPFKELDIKLFSVEYIHGNEGKDAYIDFMDKNGYDMVKEVIDNTVYVNDFMFLKR